MNFIDRLKQNSFEQTLGAVVQHFVACHPNITDDLARSTAGAMTASFSRVYLDAIGHPYGGGFTVGGITDALTATLINEPRDRFGYFIGTKPVVDYFSRFLHGGVFDAKGAEKVTFDEYARFIQNDSFYRKIGVRQ